MAGSPALTTVPGTLWVVSGCGIGNIMAVFLELQVPVYLVRSVQTRIVQGRLETYFLQFACQS